MKTINNLEKIKEIIASEEMVLTYFTTKDCNLCKDLYPKVEKMLEAFPGIVGVRGEVDVALPIVGAYGVYTAPTVILFIQGKETIRRSRKISIAEFSEATDRYYQMLF